MNGAAIVGAGRATLMKVLDNHLPHRTLQWRSGNASTALLCIKVVSAPAPADLRYAWIHRLGLGKGIDKHDAYDPSNSPMCALNRS